MFSADGLGQELAALAIVLVAAALIVQRVTGWPRRRPAAPPEATPDRVILGKRLARGLDKARSDRR